MRKLRIRMNNDQNKNLSIRLFYAFTLSDNVRASIVRAGDTLKQVIAPGQIRWTHPDDLHITALFLGNFPSDKLSLFTETGEHIAANFSPFYLSIGGYGCFPDRGGVRVVWVGGKEAADQTATKIAAKLRQSLPGIKLDQKPFKPHVTLGYAKDNANSNEIRSSAQNLPQPECGRMLIDSIVLMETQPLENRTRKPGENAPKAGMKRYNIVQTFPLVLR